MKNITEFSKKVVFLLTIVWFLGAVFGVVCVSVQLIRQDYSIGLSELLTYIGAPMTGGILGYMLKAGFENREKIKGSKEGFGIPPDVQKNISEV